MAAVVEGAFVSAPWSNLVATLDQHVSRKTVLVFCSRHLPRRNRIFLGHHLCRALLGYLDVWLGVSRNSPPL